jgi:hypothetical protein
LVFIFLVYHGARCRAGDLWIVALSLSLQGVQSLEVEPLAALTINTMEKFEAGSFLKPQDYVTEDTLGRIIALGFGAILFVCAFIVPLLK